MNVLVIIPAYNEEESILKVVQDVQNAGYDYVVINDGSTDNTAQICKDHDVNLIDLSFNLGIGGAVQTGHKYALQNGYDIDIQVDGDGQHNIAYASRLIEEIQKGADLVIGSRFISDSDGFQSTAMRRLGIKWLKECIRNRTGLTITDATSGFRACGKRAIELFSIRYSTDYPEPESIVTAAVNGLTVREAPVEMRDRQGGKSSISSIKSAYYMAKVTLAIMIEGFGARFRR